MAHTCICHELYGRLTIDGEVIDMATPHGLAQFIMHQVISLHGEEPVRFEAIQAIVAPLHRLEVLAQRAETQRHMKKFVRTAADAGRLSAYDQPPVGGGVGGSLGRKGGRG